MSEFDLGYYQKEADRLVLEIQRKLVILGLDWQSEAEMRELASRILSKAPRSVEIFGEYGSTAWLELCGLVGLMNTLMAESAGKNVEVHGDECWKAIARALWAAKDSMNP